MISRTEIDRNLRALNGKFLKARRTKDALFFSKLAIMELGGWIEVSMDDVVRRCSKRILKERDNLQLIETSIKKNHGFNYKENFRRMLIDLVGIVNVERIERRADQSKRLKMEAALKHIKASRDPEAHTYIKGTTRTIDAPSLTYSKFVDIYEGLQEIERVCRSQKF